MSQAQLAAGSDRLPWLADEPLPTAKRDAKPNPALVAGVLVAVAAASFWIATHRWMNEAPQPQPAPATTVQLPQARSLQPVTQPQEELQPEVIPAPAPEVRPAPVREIRIAPPPPVKVEMEATLAVDTPKVKAPAVPIAPTLAPAYPLTPWPPRVTAGAAGRLVQVGAFGSRLQAKRGWWAMIRSYPAMAHLPAVVTTTRNSRGRSFYRFQLGTTSQAHSEVLCQRMEKIRFSCAVIGLPWKPKGVER
jgi:SPOR domain